MKYLAGDELIKGLPLILSGPILRKTQATDVTVWIALKQSCQVNLQIFETHNQGYQIGRCVFSGKRKTAAIGKHLHIVAVTARSPNRKTLQSDCLYAYDLTFITEGHDTENTTENNNTKSNTYSLFDSLSLYRQAADTLSYFPHQKPTFTLPPTELSHLKIVHGSCRKPHGRGFDALPILDCLIELDAQDPQSRPHQLLMTGDQIYGDDVSDPLLWLATPLGDALLGWEEKLPLNKEVTEQAPTGQSTADQSTADQRWVYPKQLHAGKRAEFTTQQAGMTAGLKNKKERTTSHLLSFGEYCSIYLLAYSPACWPEHIPDGKSVTTGWKTIRQWNKDKRNMEQFLHTLWKVRRLIANIPTYTIFDDHDISDDWNLNQAWCLRTLGQPLGKRTVQNGLLAYAICQAWGNTPEQFESQQFEPQQFEPQQFESGPEQQTRYQKTGKLLLEVTERLSAAAGEDEKARETIAAYLGLPETNAHTGLPDFIEDSGVWIFRRNQKALKWHYTIRSSCHEILMLDSRTWRGYPIGEDPIAPPMLLCPSAFESQLSQPLSEAGAFESRETSDNTPHTFVVAPTNVFGMRALDWIQAWHLEQRKVFTADVGDSWNFNNRALATLLLTLFQHRKSIVVLSGDIHYSSAIHVDYQNIKSGNRAHLVQFTSSAIKNEETLTQLLHTRLKDWILPERSRQWIGWHNPPDMKEIKKSKQYSESANTAPDWQCEMSWLTRSPTQPVEITTKLSELIPPRQQPVTPLLSWLKFWKARWLQEGREVVGVNNIALVHFQQVPPNHLNKSAHTVEFSDSSKPAALAVKQKHYWFSPWQPTEVVCSRFE